ncbi:hypothetical protein L596_020090 [Steinernema carpocapsae]|uniref:Uncharacterized protein n=1 Tax=Steinernema carpocapsae TaxID=34508 RepID=A0A4U5MSH1_STECR|nr:hypothetical protein L596_020090 [Steinernema carpocapsae]
MIALSKLLSTGEVLKHPISFRYLLALANHASRNVFKGHKFQRDDLINVTEHVGALNIQSVSTVAVKYQQYIIGLQRQRPEHILKVYERPALPPGFDCFQGMRISPEMSGKRAARVTSPPYISHWVGH